MSQGAGPNRLPASLSWSASPFPELLDFPIPGKTHRWRGRGSLRCEGSFELRGRFVSQCRVEPEPVVVVIGWCSTHRRGGPRLLALHVNAIDEQDCERSRGWLKRRKLAANKWSWPMLIRATWRQSYHRCGEIQCATEL